MPRPPTRTNQLPPLPSQFPSLRTPPMAKRQSSTWVQVASKPPTLPENHTLPSSIDSIKSILSTLNLHQIRAAMRTLANRLQEARNPMDKTLLIVDAVIGYFAQSP